MAQWGNTDTLGDAPLWTENTNDTFLVDVTEAGIAANRANGVKTPGWNLYQTYTDQNGNVRKNVEVLVAMKVTAADAGDDGVTGDTLDEDNFIADA
jgi:sugar lactone lactonase YvrE